MKPLSMLSIPLLLLSGLVLASDDTTIAEVYGQSVSIADLALPAKMVAESRKTLSAEAFSAWEQDSRRQLLAFGVMEEARKRFMTEQGLDPSQQEIDGYQAYMRHFAEAESKRRAQEREKVQQELAQPGIEDERRSQLNDSIAAIDEIDKMTAPAASEEQAAERQQAEHAVAAMMVGNWKFNQGLYRKYGGQVVFQQAGMEPIDAHKAFMEELKSSGAYTIVNPAYQDLFKETDEYFDKEFKYLSPSEADAYFASPWWLQSTP